MKALERYIGPTGPWRHLRDAQLLLDRGRPAEASRRAVKAAAWFQDSDVDVDDLEEKLGAEAVNLFHTSAVFSDYMLARCTSATGRLIMNAQLLLQSLTESLDHQEEGLFSDLGTSGPTWHLADALEAALDDEEQAEDIVQELGMVFVAEARLQVWKARFAALGAEHDETAAAACELHDTIRALPATDSLQFLLEIEVGDWLGFKETLGGELDGSDTRCSQILSARFDDSMPMKLVGIDDHLSTRQELALMEGLEARLNTTAWSDMSYSQVLFDKKQYAEAGRYARAAMTWFRGTAMVDAMSGSLKRCGELDDLSEELGPDAVPYFYSSALVSMGLLPHYLLAQAQGQLSAEKLNTAARMLITFLSERPLQAALDCGVRNASRSSMQFCASTLEALLDALADISLGGAPADPPGRGLSPAMVFGARARVWKLRVTWMGAAHPATVRAACGLRLAIVGARQSPDDYASLLEDVLGTDEALWGELGDVLTALKSDETMQATCSEIHARFDVDLLDDSLSLSLSAVAGALALLAAVSSALALLCSRRLRRRTADAFPRSAEMVVWTAATALWLVALLVAPALRLLARCPPTRAAMAG